MSGHPTQDRGKAGLPVTSLMAGTVKPNSNEGIYLLVRMYPGILQARFIQDYGYSNGRVRYAVESLLEEERIIEYIPKKGETAKPKRYLFDNAPYLSPSVRQLIAPLTGSQERKIVLFMLGQTTGKRMNEIADGTKITPRMCHYYAHYLLSAGLLTANSQQAQRYQLDETSVALLHQALSELMTNVRPAILPRMNALDLGSLKNDPHAEIWKALEGRESRAEQKA